MTSTRPASPAGAVTCKRLGSIATTSLSGTSVSPNQTRTLLAKPLPRTIVRVPPEKGPCDGSIDNTACGVATGVSSGALVRPPDGTMIPVESGATPGGFEYGLSAVA